MEVGKNGKMEGWKDGIREEWNAGRMGYEGTQHSIIPIFHYSSFPLFRFSDVTFMNSRRNDGPSFES